MVHRELRRTIAENAERRKKNEKRISTIASKSKQRIAMSEKKSEHKTNKQTEQNKKKPAASFFLFFVLTLWICKIKLHLMRPATHPTYYDICPVLSDVVISFFFRHFAPIALATFGWIFYCNSFSVFLFCSLVCSSLAASFSRISNHPHSFDIFGGSDDVLARKKRIPCVSICLFADKMYDHTKSCHK